MSNVDADTLSRLPLDMEAYEVTCTEKLSDKTVRATWDGSQAAKRKDVAWITALNIAFLDRHLQPHPNLPTISHDDLVRAQREDQAINEIMELKASNTKLTDEIHKIVSGATRKLLHEWNKLYLGHDLLYQ